MKLTKVSGFAISVMVLSEAVHSINITLETVHVICKQAECEILIDCQYTYFFLVCFNVGMLYSQIRRVMQDNS